MLISDYFLKTFVMSVTSQRNMCIRLWCTQTLPCEGREAVSGISSAQEKHFSTILKKKSSSEEATLRLMKTRPVTTVKKQRNKTIKARVTTNNR